MEKEIEMMNKFKSEYLIYFYGRVKHQGTISIIFEYAKYGSMSDIIKNKDIKMNIRICKDILEGLKYLHSNGIIHRDLKPDNVLIVNKDINSKICGKLTDFGSARMISLIQTNRTFTNGIGTPIYMSPEILNGERYSLPTDIFSFGIILYECYLFEKPYQDKKLFPHSWSVPQFIQSGKRLNKLDNINDRMWKLINKCWDENPKERPDNDYIIEQLQLEIETLK